MNEFEFQRFVTIGQYLPTGSVIHRLDPRVRLVAGTLLLLAITFSPHPVGLGVALLTLLGTLKLAQVPLKYALRGLLPPLPFILFLALLQILFGFQRSPAIPLAATNFQLELFNLDLQLYIPWSKILGALMLLMRFAALILGISLISFCISTTELVRGSASLLRPLRRLGLPTHDFILMIQVALHFLPILAREAEHIAKAQASRGAEWGTTRRQGLCDLFNLGAIAARVRQVLPLLVPLFLTALHRAENLALAMEARGYSTVTDPKTARTSMVTLRFHWKDGVALVITIGITLMILGLP
jgi:energy-coupling factor transport system permease protein